MMNKEPSIDEKLKVIDLAESALRRRSNRWNFEKIKAIKGERTVRYSPAGELGGERTTHIL